MDVSSNSPDRTAHPCGLCTVTLLSRLDGRLLAISAPLALVGGRVFLKVGVQRLLYCPYYKHTERERPKEEGRMFLVFMGT